MELDNIALILIYLHAGFGGIALFAGSVALASKKGKSIHKKFGKLFYYAMLISAITAMIISLVPNHENPFLFSIGIFSSYFILTGYRALRFKKKNLTLLIDKFISVIMICTGITMVIFPILFNHSINIVLTVFGISGLIFSIQDLRLFKNTERLKKDWLKMHVGKMIGGYIAAVTAFVVVNNVFPGIYGWFIPGIVGGIYIAYWTKKLNLKSKVQSY